MKKLLIVAVALIAIMAPAYAWDVTWTDGFEAGNLNNWTQFSGAAAGSLAVATAPDPVRTGTYSFREGASSKQDMIYKDMRALTATNVTFKTGQVEAWIYDDGTTANRDMRVGTLSTAGVITGFNPCTITMTAPNWGGVGYYTAGWSYSYAPMDGGATAAPVFTGTTWTAGAAAPRSAGWHRFRATWDYTVAGEATFKYYVDSTLAPKMTCVMVSSCTRWANTSNVAKAQLGTFSAVNHLNTFADDFAFRGDAVPEPSSLLALGAGLMGVVGLIRRRR